MAYEIEVSPRAAADVDAIVDYISKDSIDAAIRWKELLFRKLDGFVLFPQSCPYAPENTDRAIEIRQAVFGNYRILFTIVESEKLVRVLTVRHGARRSL